MIDNCSFERPGVLYSQLRFNTIDRRLFKRWDNRNVIASPDPAEYQFIFRSPPPCTFVLSLPPSIGPLLSHRNLLTESASANSESLNFFSSRLLSLYLSFSLPMSLYVSLFPSNISFLPSSFFFLSVFILFFPFTSLLISRSPVKDVTREWGFYVVLKEHVITILNRANVSRMWLMNNCDLWAMCDNEQIKIFVAVWSYKKNKHYYRKVTRRVQLAISKWSGNLNNDHVKDIYYE